MRLIAIVALALSLTQNSTGAEIAADGHGLELRYELIELKNPGLKEATNELQVLVEIVNRGTRKVVIPTKGIGPLTLWNGQAASIYFRPLVLTRTRDGRHIVIPIADLAPVELKPNEVAVLHCKLRVSRNAFISSVEYELSPAFAERYGFWSGKLAASIRRMAEAEQTDEREPE